MVQIPIARGPRPLPDLQIRHVPYRLSSTLDRLLLVLQARYGSHVEVEQMLQIDSLWGRWFNLKRVGDYRPCPLSDSSSLVPGEGRACAVDDRAWSKSSPVSLLDVLTLKATPAAAAIFPVTRMLQ